MRRTKRHLSSSWTSSEAVGASRITVCELTRCLPAEECSMFGDTSRSPPTKSGISCATACWADLLLTAASSCAAHHHMATRGSDRGNQAFDGQHDPRHVYLCFTTPATSTFSRRTSRLPRSSTKWYRPRSPQGHPSRHDGKGLRRGLPNSAKAVPRGLLHHSG